MSSAARSRVMSRIRGKDTLPELAIAAGLLRKRIRLERHAKDCLGGRTSCVAAVKWRCLSTEASGMGGDSRSGNTSCRRNGRTRSPPIVPGPSEFCPAAQARLAGSKSLEHQIEREADACVLRIVAFPAGRSKAGARRNQTCPVRASTTAFITGGQTAFPTSLIFSRRVDGGHW